MNSFVLDEIDGCFQRGTPFAPTVERNLYLEARVRHATKRHIYLQAIFALAAALAMTTVACSSEQGAPAKKTGTAGAAAGELDGDSGTAATHGTGDVGTTGVGGIAESESGGLAVDSVVYYDPSGLTPEQIFSRKQEIGNGLLGDLVRSDIRSARGETLYYTGAGQDTLREQLHVLVNNRAATLDADTLEGDRQFARVIRLADFEVDWSRRLGVLNFRFDRNGRETSARLEGYVDENMRFTVGSVYRHPYIEAEAACMDISGGCRTVHVRVKDASTGKIRTAHLLARHTNATLYIEGNEPGVSKNPEYDRLMSILLKTVKNPSSYNVVNKLTITTSETIGGASAFAVRMGFRLLDQTGKYVSDAMQFTGPLVKPQASDQALVGANVSSHLTYINGVAVPVSGRIVETVRGARLLKNDGHGNLQLEVTVRNVALGGAEDRVVLTIARIHTPTMAVRIQAN
ncbi:MAG: hypothetical protein RBT63_08655 [Bdellovibrionales bacterium]|nr:hypothetical protein [Bdellovibrionales bacterium]